MAPKLRQKTITPFGTDQVRVELELQDAVLGQFRVMIQHDRALGTGIQQVPFPVVETGATRYRYATLENAGRDELIVDEATGFEVVQRQSPPWDYLRQHLQGGNLTLAYVTMSSGNDLKLGFHTK